MPTYARFIVIFALSAFGNIAAIPSAQADNEFGAPFWNQSTTALEDSSQEPQNELMATDMDAAAAALQDIQPAAGDADDTGADADIVNETEAGTTTP